MRIAIYTAPLPVDKTTWLEEDRFAFEIITRLVKKYTDQEFIWITPYSLKGASFQFDSISHLPLSASAPAVFSFKRTSGRKLSSLLKDQKVDALLSLNLTLSARIPCPFCLVVWHPVSASAPERIVRRFSKGVKNADSIATISAVEKEQLSSQYAIPPEKITVIHRSVHEDFQPFDWEEREQIKGDYTDGHEYFMYVGEIRDRQNIINLLKAFSILKKRLRSNMTLVLAGPLSREFKDFPEMMGTYYFRNDVRWIKEVTMEERMRLTGGAYALICPAPPKGFGSEILEAFSCRVPVLATDHPLTREIGEDAILYFNPLHVEKTGDLFCEIYKDENIRARLIALGDIQAKKYSWDKTIARLWTAMNDATHP